MQWVAEIQVGAERKCFDIEAGSREEARREAENLLYAAQNSGAGLAVRLASLLTTAGAAARAAGQSYREAVHAPAVQQRADFDAGLTSFPHKAGCDCRMCHLEPLDRAIRDLRAAEKCVKTARASVEVREADMKRLVAEQQARVNDAKAMLERREAELVRAQAAYSALQPQQEQPEARRGRNGGR